MKTLILNGSPRPDGDTAALIKALTAQLDGEVKTVNCYTAHISPCVDCRRCMTRPGCAIDDDMREVYGYLTECDNVVTASPLFFSEVTGRLLDVGSRLQTYYCARFFRSEPTGLSQKRGGVILAGGGDGSPDRAFATSRTLLHQMNCTEIAEPVLSLKTNTLPAAEDAAAAEGIKRLAEFLNRV